MNDSIKNILEGSAYCTVATVSEGGAPWSVPVRFAFDDSYIYFRSSPDAVHSKNIEANPNVSIVIFDTTQAVRGAVYIHSRAEKLDGGERENALTIFNHRFNNPPDQWGNTSYFRVALGMLDTEKTVERMFYFQEYTA